MQDKNGIELKKDDRVCFHWIAAGRDGYVDATVLMIHPNGFAILRADDGWTNNAWPGQLEKIADA
jgi:hypothetical protein